uniref:Ribosomal protein S11 n=1 Tax=Kryptoperidinium foliaceum endosymbiont TaxID=1079369 RepID=I6N5S0_9STRA|nr:ribosomal protein S11 [Kryptoperidinium foliaceum endosymbiont]
MNLSHTLFNTVSNKLRLKVSLLNEEKLYVKSLRAQIESLKKIKENSYKDISIQKNQLENGNNQNLVIMYVINISFLKANTTIHVSDIKGNMKLFYSAGSVGLAGKQKRKRRVAALKLISLILKRATFLNKKPVALHLKNVNSYKNIIVSKLKRSLFIRVVKSFNQIPYNGCRKKKVRRKKYTKKFR